MIKKFKVGDDIIVNDKVMKYQYRWGPIISKMIGKKLKIRRIIQEQGEIKLFFMDFNSFYLYPDCCDPIDKNDNDDIIKIKWYE